MENRNDKIQKKVNKYFQENNKLLIKYKLGVRLVVNFSKRTKTPILSKIALWVVAKQGGQLNMQFGEAIKK